MLRLASVIPGQRLHHETKVYLCYGFGDARRVVAEYTVNPGWVVPPTDNNFWYGVIPDDRESERDEDSTTQGEPMWQSHPHPEDVQALREALYELDDEYGRLLATNAISHHAHHAALTAGMGRESAARAVAVRLADQLETLTERVRHLEMTRPSPVTFEKEEL